MDHCLEEVLQHVGHPDAGLSANGAENTGKVRRESPGVRRIGKSWFQQLKRDLSGFNTVEGLAMEGEGLGSKHKANPTRKGFKVQLTQNIYEVPKKR